VRAGETDAEESGGARSPACDGNGHRGGCWEAEPPTVGAPPATASSTTAAALPSLPFAPFPLLRPPTSTPAPASQEGCRRSGPTSRGERRRLGGTLCPEGDSFLSAVVKAKPHRPCSCLGMPMRTGSRGTARRPPGHSGGALCRRSGEFSLPSAFEFAFGALLFRIYTGRDELGFLFSFSFFYRNNLALDKL
jgi:hypothetical protein